VAPPFLWSQGVPVLLLPLLIWCCCDTGGWCPLLLLAAIRPPPRTTGAVCSAPCPVAMCVGMAGPAAEAHSSCCCLRGVPHTWAVGHARFTAPCLVLAPVARRWRDA
jgi:hypothetical protein